MDAEKLSEKTTKFFPRAKDWPPPERQKTISSHDMVKSEISRNFVNPLVPN